MHRLISTAAPQPPAAPIEGDPYSEGYVEGRLEERAAVVMVLRAVGASLPLSWAREASMLAGAADSIERGHHLVDLGLAPGPTADRAQVRALGGGRDAE